MRKICPGFTVDSAGTANWHSGKPPYQPMMSVAAQRGIDLGDLRGRQVTAEDFDRFDMILAMDLQNRADLEALRPAGNTTPVRLLMEFAPEAECDEVPDPYFTRDFDQVLDLVEIALSGLCAQLQ